MRVFFPFGRVFKNMSKQIVNQGGVSGASTGQLDSPLTPPPKTVTQSRTHYCPGTQQQVGFSSAVPRSLESWPYPGIGGLLVLFSARMNWRILVDRGVCEI